MPSVRRKVRDAWGTLRLLYDMDRRAFLIGTVTSVVQSLMLPLVLLVVWKGFSLVLTGEHAFLEQAVLVLGGLFALLALETLLRIVNETATTVLKAESAQQVNARIMGKMSEVPYRLFEDNDFQARYGLLISQASYRPGLLVDSFVGSVSALVASLAIAATLFALAPLLDVFVLLLIPLTIAETRYHGRLLNLQVHSAPELFRMVHLTQKSIDATWQRDMRVHNSSVLGDEYRVLAHRYVGRLRRLLQRYQLIRAAIGVGAAAVTTLAMGVVFWQVSHSSAGPAQAAILLPALFMGLSQGRAFSSSWGELTECLGYLGQVFDFLNQSFEAPASVPARPAGVVRPAPALAGSARQ
jgi:ABC-type multidrug transport system fused ATPase/permease subunit